MGWIKAALTFLGQLFQYLNVTKLINAGKKEQEAESLKKTLEFLDDKRQADEANRDIDTESKRERLKRANKAVQ